MTEIFDTIIIGAGPAGITAGIYTKRAGFSCLVLEKNFIAGGQILNTHEVDNYPALRGINGFDLGMKMREHADHLGVDFRTTSVLGIIDSKEKIKKVITSEDELLTKTIIIATGARHRKLGINGEDKFTGKGISYCATCDGAFFKGKTVAVVGGGDVAVEDAIFLARICNKVHLIHRRDSLRAAKSLQKKLFDLKNIELIWNSEITDIKGSDQVNEIEILNKAENGRHILEVAGVFIAVGIQPNTNEFSNIVELDENGYIKAGEMCKTNIDGIFAAGDVKTKVLRQIVTAVADGANAVDSVEKYLLREM